VGSRVRALRALHDRLGRALTPNRVGAKSADPNILCALGPGIGGERSPQFLATPTRSPDKHVHSFEKERVTTRIRIQALDKSTLAQGGFLLLLVIGVACLALFLWCEFEARYFQASLSQDFDEQLQRPAGLEGGTEGELPRHSPSAKALPGLIGRLEIPRIGVEVMVLNGADARTLRRGAGWLPFTARPGRGNAAIAAHRDTFFRPLRRIKEGDIIHLSTLDGRYDFRVDWTAVLDPSDTAVLRPTKKPTLTLITCYPFYYVGKAPQRFIVRASRQRTLEHVTGKLSGGNQRPTLVPAL
jgi:sortase A